MEHRHDLHKHNTILKTLAKLPRKIVSTKQHVNIPLFILYDFCDESCFNFSKIAYFVDNPDFNCLRGIAGILKSECKLMCEVTDIWQKPEQFNLMGEQLTFNKQVRAIEKQSISKNHGSDKEMMNQLASELIFSNPNFVAWNSKHDNTGYLIFERSCDHGKIIDEHLGEGAYLLSFCPII